MVISCFSQENFDPYLSEEKGYYINFKQTAGGIVFTDNYSSGIYLFENGKTRLLVSSPGCGRYLTVSPDLYKIGFKYIDQQGFQSPACYDLKLNKVIYEDEPVRQCGQPSFTRNGHIVYSYGNEIVIKKDTVIRKFCLKNFANIAPVSPDGKYLVYSGDYRQFYLLDLEIGTELKLEDDSISFLYPQWSPDSRKIAVSGSDGFLYVYNLDEIKFNRLFPGLAPSWSDDSRRLYFHRQAFLDSVLVSSEICCFDLEKKSVSCLSGPVEMAGMYPCETGGKLVFADLAKRKVMIMDVSGNSTVLSKPELLFEMPEKISISYLVSVYKV